MDHGLGYLLKFGNLPLFFTKLSLITWNLTSELVRVANVSEYAVEAEEEENVMLAVVKSWTNKMMHAGQPIIQHTAFSKLKQNLMNLSVVELNKN